MAERDTPAALGTVCNASAPDRSGRRCDLGAGHDGVHWTYGGETLTWPTTPPAPDREALVQLLRDAETALAHLEVCGGCGEDSWNECPGGRQAAETLSAISLVLRSIPPTE